MKVARVKEMQEMDKYAMEILAISEDILMENAGLAATAILEKEIGLSGKRYAVVCGTGNNGGDGFVVARKIHSNGGVVQVFIIGDTSRLKGAARVNFDIMKKLAIPVTVVASPHDVRDSFSLVDGIVDGLFGTGLDREIAGLHRDVINQINTAGKKVLSLDIPSGIHGDTGAVLGVAVKADYTVAFGLPKVGNLLYPGYSYCGKLHVSHISFPPSLYNRGDLKIETNASMPLPPRDPQAHKGSVGDCLFIAGAAGYFGAPYFSAMSFLKAGGGYSRLAAPASLIGCLAPKGPEIVYVPQRETAEGTLAPENRDALLALSDKVDMAVIGPGLSLHAETQQLVRDLVRDIRVPLLIDGDGITAISEEPAILRKRHAPTVLTPHLGEMSRLTGKTVAEIQSGSISILQETAKHLQCVIVLKGAHSLIGFPDGRIMINLSGNSGMATAGAGDVLTGIIAAMSGLGLSFDDAVCKGVFIHGLAGDIAARAKGPDGMTAQDILAFVPQALLNDREMSATGIGPMDFVIYP